MRVLPRADSSRVNADLHARSIADWRIQVGVLVGLDDATLVAAPSRFGSARPKMYASPTLCR